MGQEIIEFAAFIITFERPLILVNSIKKLFGQTVPPKKILIIDNGNSIDAENVIKKLEDERVIYLRTGKNLGPAGAAKIGLEILVKEGYKWIYWGDDDDPPLYDTVCEDLLNVCSNVQGVGVAGAVGHYFNKKRGMAIRLPDTDIVGHGILELDVIAGNMNMLVSAEVVKLGILPDPILFMGSEEYDFCLRVRSAGFKVIVPKPVFNAYRKIHERYNLPKRPAVTFPPQKVLWRRYYATRNLINFLKRSEGGMLGAFSVSARAIGKAFFGFSCGWEYGVINAKMELKGLYDGWRNNMGLTVLPNLKY